MSETPPVPDMPDPLSQFAAEPEDGIGLAAFGLHARRRAEWHRAFVEGTGRAPDAALLLGDITAPRIAAYRAEAERLLGQRATARPRPISPWWRTGLGTAPVDPAGPIPWGALFARLALLMAAVIVTALALRVVFVRG